VHGAVAEKPHDAVVKFDTYRNLQRLRAVLPAIARYHVLSLCLPVSFNIVIQRCAANSVIRFIYRVTDMFKSSQQEDKAKNWETRAGPLFFRGAPWPSVIHAQISKEHRGSEIALLRSKH